jgi:Ca-activated chloride channel homolog
MSFIWREALWLLLALPVLPALYALWLYRRRKLAVRYSSIEFARAAEAPGQRVRRHLPPALLFAGIVILTLGLARPAALLERPVPDSTVVLAIDVSLSMAATDIQPNRLAAAQSAAKTFVYAQPRDVRIAIVAFAGVAHLVQAPTRDRAALSAAIDRLQLAYHTAIGNAIVVSLATLDPGHAEPAREFSASSGRSALKSAHAARGPLPAREPVPPGSKASAAIVLLTDGENTTGVAPAEAAQIAAGRGMRVYTVGFGKPTGGLVEADGWSMHVGFDERSLRQIAETTGGQYFHASSGRELEKIYRELVGRLVVEPRETELTALFTALAAVLSLAAALLSLAWSTRLT